MLTIVRSRPAAGGADFRYLRDFRYPAGSRTRHAIWDLRWDSSHLL